MSYCDWDTTDELCLRYHDEEWGVPLHDDRGQFEYLSLEVMQCGLNWTMMLHKREVIRGRASTVLTLMLWRRSAPMTSSASWGVPGMIRSRRKVEAIINNARCFQQVREEFGSFDAYLWGWSGRRHDPLQQARRRVDPGEQRPLARVAADLKRRGFKYLGPTTVYSHLQACGIINDHARLPALRGRQRLGPTVEKRRYLEKDVRHYE